MLGDPLFLRGAQGMEPTPFAEQIVPDIREHLAGIASVLNDASTFDAANSQRVFRLSLSGLGEQVFLAPLAKRVFERAPGVRLENIPSPFRDLSRTLAARESEVAIGLLDSLMRNCGRCTYTTKTIGSSALRSFAGTRLLRLTFVESASFWRPQA